MKSIFDCVRCAFIGVGNPGNRENGNDTESSTLAMGETDESCMPLIDTEERVGFGGRQPARPAHVLSYKPPPMTSPTSNATKIYLAMTESTIATKGEKGDDCVGKKDNDDDDDNGDDNDNDDDDNDDEQEEECVICLEPFDDTNPKMPTLCGCGENMTYFHLPCLYTWRSRCTNSRAQSLECPSCRKELCWEEL